MEDWLYFFATCGISQTTALAYSWREAARMRAGLAERQRLALVGPALVETAIYNYGGMRGKKFKGQVPWERYPGIVPRPPAARGRSPDELKERHRRANEQERRYMKAVRKAERRRQKDAA